MTVLCTSHVSGYGQKLRNVTGPISEGAMAQRSVRTSSAALGFRYKPMLRACPFVICDWLIGKNNLEVPHSLEKPHDVTFEWNTLGVGMDNQSPGKGWVFLGNAAV